MIVAASQTLAPAHLLGQSFGEDRQLLCDACIFVAKSRPEVGGGNGLLSVLYSVCEKTRNALLGAGFIEFVAMKKLE